MTYKLIGSLTSPYVRRMRMVMENLPFELQEINIFEGPGLQELNKVNPLNQIPVLLDGEKTIWDSRVIFNYLNKKHNLQELSWEEENTLTAVEGALTSGINLFLLKRSGINTEESSLFIDRQKARIESVLHHLKPYLEDKALDEWNFQTMTIYAFLEWATFRKVISLDDKPYCQAFLNKHAYRPAVKATAIPKV